jgi:phosphatidylglycerophosphatase C
MTNDAPKKTAIFDLDGTITRKDTYVSFLLNFLLSHPLRLIISSHLLLAVIFYKMGFRDNTWLKVTFLRTILGGISRNEVHRCAIKFVDILVKKGLNQGALQAINKHQKAGDHLILLSASFDFYVQEIGRRLVFDEIICTRAEWDDKDRVTGNLTGKNCYGSNKIERLEEYFSDRADNWSTTVYTDHHSDLPLLEWADHGVAVNPTRILLQKAQAKGLKIEEW